MKDSLIISDLDGTLVDTGRANYESYKAAIEFCAEKWNINYADFMKRCFGRNFRIFLKEISDIPEEKYDVIHRRKSEIYEDFLRQYGKLNRSLYNMLMGAREISYLTLLTTASKHNTETVLRLFEMKDFFDLVIAGDDVKELKPDPQGVYMAMKYFDMAPSDTALFDDSSSFAKIAEELGITTYQVRMRNIHD